MKTVFRQCTVRTAGPWSSVSREYTDEPCILFPEQRPLMSLGWRARDKSSEFRDDKGSRICGARYQKGRICVKSGDPVDKTYQRASAVTETWMKRLHSAEKCFNSGSAKVKQPLGICMKPQKCHALRIRATSYDNL